MEKQIKDIYYKAFCDKINETINSDKPDFDWIVLLYKEIKQRILVLVTPNSKTYNDIDQSFDIILFEQMIKNNVFNNTDMIQLVSNSYFWINKLQAPIRDTETNESKNKVLQSDHSKIVSVFIIEVNKCIDNIIEDLQNIKKNLSGK
jgi:hypothetical protein